MAGLKKFICGHKKMSVAICIFIVIAVVASTAGIIISKHNSREAKEKEQETSFKDWDNLIADLEEEPVSELDESYKDVSSDKDKQYKISVNKTQNYITIYEKDKHDKYTKAVKNMLCSVGFDTPSGSFTTSDKYAWKIVNGNVWAQYATRVTGNVLIHSMPYREKDKGTLLPDYYNQLGRTLSTSCIRVSAGDANWIMKNCKKGTVVDIFESDEEVAEIPSSIKVPDDAAWDPTDPDDANPWKSVKLEFKGLENVINIERGSQLDYMQGVTITDTCGNDISSKVKVTTEMDVFKPGTYIAKYEVSDATGKKAEKDVTFQVHDTTAPKLCGLLDTLYFSSVGAVTRESVLKGVTVLDNNQVMSLDVVQVNLPVVAEGVNQVTITAQDSYNNVMTTTINVIVDSKPPVVNLKAGVPKIIPLTQNVDKAYALSRIEASDDGKPVEESQISVSIVPKFWGYSLYYKVLDKQGNVTNFQDEVNYVEYTITPSGKLSVTDISDKSQLIKGVLLKGNDGSAESVDKLKYTVEELTKDKYQITYSYSFSCPLGTKTVTATDSFTMKSSATPTPLPDDDEEEPEGTVQPSHKPVASSTPPANTKEP